MTDTLVLLVPALAIARPLATSLAHVMREDDVRTARAKRLRERSILVRHGLRNAARPALTMGGLQFGLLLAGIVVVAQAAADPRIRTV
jgi:peptide/nickel transport system permease protein